MLNEIAKFGINFNIKFNNKKTLLIVFSKYKFININEINIYLNNSLIKIVDNITLLGFKLNFNLDCNSFAIDNFNSTKNSFFSLYPLGMKAGGLNPFIYKNN